MQSSGSDSPLGAQTPELRRRFVSQSRKFGRKELINHSDRLRVEKHRQRFAGVFAAFLECIEPLQFCLAVCDAALKIPFARILCD